MELDNLTLALEGDVFLNDFGRAVRNFEVLLRRLTEEYRGKAPVEWEVTEIVSGSALVTIGSSSPDQETVERVVRAYADIGHNLEQGRPLVYPKKISDPAQRLAAIPNGHITSVRFQTPESDAIVSSNSRERGTDDDQAIQEWLDRPRRRWSYGAVEGRIQTLSSRQALRFTLFDSLNDKAVICYLTSKSAKQMEVKIADFWDKRAVVSGKVFRDPLTRRPIAIREISEIRAISDYEPGQFRRALGADKSKPDDPLPETIIRQVRDAV